MAEGVAPCMGEGVPAPPEGDVVAVAATVPEARGEKVAVPQALALEERVTFTLPLMSALGLREVLGRGERERDGGTA